MHLVRTCLLALMAVAALPPHAGAEGVRGAALPPATIVATAIPPATAMRIDGELSEAIWAQVPVVTGFVQRDPREGAPATFDTEVRVAFDDTALYIAVDALDPEPSKAVGILTRRDESSPSDYVRVYIDSFRDRRTAYEFSVNAAGVKGDSYWYADGNMVHFGDEAARRAEPGGGAALDADAAAVPQPPAAVGADRARPAGR